MTTKDFQDSGFKELATFKKKQQIKKNVKKQEVA
jgi:hypothetical protein